MYYTSGVKTLSFGMTAVCDGVIRYNTNVVWYGMDTVMRAWYFRYGREAIRTTIAENMEASFRGNIIRNVSRKTSCFMTYLDPDYKTWPLSLLVEK